MGTDGSGGANSQDPRLRRCGWGFVVLGSDESVIAQGRGPLPGWRQTVPLAELTAVQAAVLSTTNEALTVYLDNVSVVKGILRGPSRRHARNAYRWRVFWECVGDRRIIPIKIKSHTTRADAEAAGTSGLAWQANRLADELAETAATEAQLPQSALDAVKEVDTEASQVLEHLCTVAHAVAAQAPKLYGPSSRFARRAEATFRAKARKTATDEALRVTAHRWCGDTRRCLACLLRPSQQQPLLEFLGTPCSRRPHQIHSTHKPACHRGLWYCEVCGANGHKTFSSLARKCEKPGEHGKRTLKCIREDRLPQHLRASGWPDEGEELSLS